MRIIPKKIKVKNTVWKCYSMADVIVALVVFTLIFIAITAGSWVFAVIMGLCAVVMFMPTLSKIIYGLWTVMENCAYRLWRHWRKKKAEKLPNECGQDKR